MAEFALSPVPVRLATKSRPPILMASIAQPWRGLRAVAAVNDIS
jgi:hypothetical protein